MHLDLPELMELLISFGTEAIVFAESGLLIGIFIY
jgi:hypothetical protein